MTAPQPKQNQVPYSNSGVFRHSKFLFDGLNGKIQCWELDELPHRTTYCSLGNTLDDGDIIFTWELSSRKLFIFPYDKLSRLLNIFEGVINESIQHKFKCGEVTFTIQQNRELKSNSPVVSITTPIIYNIKGRMPAMSDKDKEEFTSISELQMIVNWFKNINVNSKVIANKL